MADFSVVFSNLTSLFLLIGAGYLITRLDILPASMSGPAGKLLLNVTLPCTIFLSLATQAYDPHFLEWSLWIVGLGFALLLAGIAFSLAMTRLFHVPEGRRGIWAFGATFSNNGFMGFPIILSLYGKEGLALSIMFSIPFNALVYSLGARLVQMDSTDSSAQIKWKNVLFSNINLSLCAGIIFYFAGLPIQAALQKTMSSLSDMTTPLSMIVIGMALAKSKAGDLVRDKDAYTCALVRLVIFPVATLLLLRLLPISNPLVIKVMAIILAMPAPSVISVLAETHGGNTDFAAKIVFITSALSLATISLFSMLL